MLEKPEILGGNIAHSTIIPEIKCGSSIQKVRKSRYQTFSALFNFVRFLYFVLDIFPGIVTLYNWYTSSLNLVSLEWLASTNVHCFLGRRSQANTSPLYTVPVSLTSSYLISSEILDSVVYKPGKKNGKILPTPRSLLYKSNTKVGSTGK